MAHDEEHIDPHGECAAEIARLRSALEGLSNMYSYAWDLADGGLMMMPDSIPKFEAAHAAARTALGFNDIDEDQGE